MTAQGGQADSGGTRGVGAPPRRARRLALAAGSLHLVLVGGALAVLGQLPATPGVVPGAGGLVVTVLVQAVLATALVAVVAGPVFGLLALRLRLPVVVGAVALVVVVALEVVTPGPWVTVLDGDRLIVGNPVLRSYAESTPLLLAVLGLVGLGETRLRARHVRQQRPSWRRALGVAGLGALGTVAATALAGLSRGWAASPPPFVLLGVSTLVLLAAGAVVLLLRTRLVSPFLVLVTATATAVVALWVQDPRFTDPAEGLIAGAAIWSTSALLLGLAEGLVRGVVRVFRRSR